VTGRFPPETLSLLGRTGEVRILTQPRSGPERRTTIWVVVDGDEVFVRSVRGPRGRWYRDLEANPSGALLVAGYRIDFRAVATPDPAAIARASEALERKYVGGPATRSMLQPETLPTTLRLDPARPCGFAPTPRG